MNKNSFIRIISAIVLLAFGLLTLYLSSSILFDWFDVRAKQGNYVLFIVGINFSCAILYLTAVDLSKDEIKKIDIRQSKPFSDIYLKKHE